MKKFYLFLFSWLISTTLIIVIIFSYKLKKEKELKENFYSTAKLISKQRVDAGLRVLSSFYHQKEENEREKFLLIDKMIREFNLDKNFSFDKIFVEFTANKELSHNYLFFKDVINEEKIVYIYEKISNIKDKVLKLIPSLFDAFRFGKKGYIFVYDDKGNCYYHYDKSLIGKNRWNLKRNGVYIVRLLIKKAKENPNGTYVKYLAFNPEGKPTEKISYVVYFAPLNLMLGSGVYLKDLHQKLKQLDKELEIMFLQAEITMSLVLLIIFLVGRKRAI